MQGMLAALSPFQTLGTAAFLYSKGSRCLLAGQELVPMCEEGYRGPGILGANLGVENPSRKFRNLEGESRRGKEGGRIDGDAARLRNPRL